MSAQPDGGEEKRRVDCGHLVSDDEVVHQREITLCEECYTPFDVTEWPERLGKHKHRVIEARGSSTVTNTEYLLGLDRRGRAVYYDGENCRIKTYVPMHDRAYRKDRRKRTEKREKYVTPEKGHGVLRPERFTETKPEPAPAFPGDFITLPNGDHIVCVEISEKVKDFGLEEKVRERAIDWKQMNPEQVQRFDMQNVFGTESGKRLKSMECRDCGHAEEDVDPETHSRCPECDSHSFYQGVRDQ